MSGTKGIWTLLGATAIATLAMMPGARADATEDLLRQLRAKGILNESEYRTLLGRKQTEDAEKAQATEAATAAAVAAAKAEVTSGDNLYVRFKDPAKGIGLQIGPVDVSLSGSVNAFYVGSDKDRNNQPVALGAVGGRQDTSSVRNGLLPGFLKIDVSTTDDGITYGGHFGLYPGINSVEYTNGANSGGAPQGLATSGIDFRQVYMTIASDRFGEFKAGRDIGLFGSEAILNDMLLLGVGAGGSNGAPSNTSLGHIGTGYIYTDFQPQLTYTTPDLNGFKASVGIFQPLDTVAVLGPKLSGHETPGFQGKLTYDFKSGDFGGRLFAGGIVQELSANIDAGEPTNAETTAYAFEIGGKLSYGGASVLGYYYNGQAIGTTGLFYGSIAANGNARDSEGFLVQASYTFDRFTLGASYGASYLDLAAGEARSILVEKNESTAFQARYALRKWATVVGEYIHTEATAHDGSDATEDLFALGTIIFF
ncbi:porin [Zavarzinia compransoris]|uniref:Porin n=1 Tax=Zavarzinia compransoris TaxID=1264899 RepID=A0A317DWR9_9PROT|nr:porin [Zavarzinia compransoris]PWR18882.1 porin [Zavarzinia compransoris]TDP48877.1 putative porin [Zavarzinia compransoris]